MNLETTALGEHASPARDAYSVTKRHRHTWQRVYDTS